MSTATIPSSADDTLALVESLLVSLAAPDQDPAGVHPEITADRLRALERIDAVGAAVRGRLLVAFDAAGGPVGDGHRTTRAWLVHATRITKAQAAEHKAVQALAADHPRLHAALAQGWIVTKSAALQLARWTKAIPGEHRDEAEDLLAAAAGKGAGLPALAAICAEILARLAGPDPDGDPGPDRAVYLDTTLDGAGVIRGDLTPECAAMVRSVIDALSAPAGADDQRTRPERYHDALQEAMKRLLASDLLPKRAGQPVKALVHISFAELLDLDRDGILQDKWIAEYRARWAARRAEASVTGSDGGAWLHGATARQIACDALIIPVVTGDIDPGALDDLILLCVRYHHLRTPAPEPDATDADTLADLEQQILAKILRVVSGPGGAASVLRRTLLGKPLAGPSLPLDVGQTDDIPAHLRRLVALRDQHCQYPGGCDQPASACEPHHVIHRKHGGPTSLPNLKNYCWWHHHVVLHELGWQLTVNPDGTSHVTSPDGKTIHSNRPPPRPG